MRQDENLKVIVRLCVQAQQSVTQGLESSSGSLGADEDAQERLVDVTVAADSSDERVLDATFGLADARLMQVVPHQCRLLPPEAG
ncbi:MAG: hypothetical protein V9F04_11435 [Dermatophilaceae bacterium]